MKKALVLILLLISSNCFSQRKNESVKIVDSISKIINKHVTFVSWYVENDTIKITQFTTYDNVNKKYEHFYIEDIKKYYPILLNLLTTKIQNPLSSSHRSHVDDIDGIQSFNLRYRTNLT